MTSRTYSLDQTKLDSLLSELCRGRAVFALEADKDQYHLVRSTEWNSQKHTLGAFRPIEPLKALVFPPRELVGTLHSRSERQPLQERIAIGVKNCDLSALKIHDFVFLKSEPIDPFYAEAREKTILVSCDCTSACSVCFCPAVNQQPYAKDGYDVNISTISAGYLIESGSDRGAALLAGVERYLAAADKAMIEERDTARAAVNRSVCEQAQQKGLKCVPGIFQKAIQETVESDLWDKFAEDCVECGACNLACCTCHCFLLADGRVKGNAPARVKQWDSCLYKNFARVAGGANPRKHRADRLYNRFDKKFNFFPQVLGSYACDGCGRCIEACTGKIDIREVLKKATDEL